MRERRQMRDSIRERVCVLFIGTPSVTIALRLRQLSCDKEEMCSLIQPQILTDLSSRVSAPLDAYHLDSPALPAYPSWIGGHVLTKAFILSSLCMSLSRFSFLTTFLFPWLLWSINCRPSFFMPSLHSLCLDFPVEQAVICVLLILSL